MEEQTGKIQRSSNLIKVFMALVVVVQAVQVYQTDTLDLGAIAGSLGCLSLLRGFLLSPLILITPVKNWFKPAFKFSKESHKYFLLAGLLIVVSLL